MKEQLEQLATQMYEGGITLDEATESIRRAFLVAALTDQNGNQFRTAKRIGLHRNSVQRMVTEFNIDVREIKGNSWKKQAQSVTVLEAMEATA